MMEVYLGGSHKEIIDGQFYSATAKIIFAVRSGYAVRRPLYCRWGIRKKNQETGGALSRCLVAAGWIMLLVIVILGIMFSGLGRDYLPTYWSDFRIFQQSLENENRGCQTICSLSAVLAGTGAVQ